MGEGAVSWQLGALVRAPMVGEHVASFEACRRQVLGISKKSIRLSVVLIGQQERPLQDVHDLIPYPEARRLFIISVNVKGKLGKPQLFFLRSQRKCWPTSLFCLGTFPGRSNLVFCNSMAAVHLYSASFRVVLEWHSPSIAAAFCAVIRQEPYRCQAEKQPG